jgi:hypothetical protein
VGPVEDARSFSEWFFSVVDFDFQKSAVLFFGAALFPFVLMVVVRIFWPGKESSKSTSKRLGRDVVGATLCLGMIAFYHAISKKLACSSDELKEGFTIGMVFTSLVLGTQVVSSQYSEFLKAILSQFMPSTKSEDFKKLLDQVLNNELKKKSDEPDK